jgi:CHAT domain-containing protein
MFDYPKAKIKLKIEAFGASSMYPWELMHDGDDFLCLKSATVRREAGSRTYEEMLDVKGVLVVASNPLGDLENVEREANSVLNSIKRIGDIESKLLSGKDATKENVIKEIESGRYQVIHYSGHSNFDEKSPGNSYLLLKDGRKLKADELARLSKDKELHLVFLNSCLSGADKVDVFNVTGLSSAFVKSGVPNVIGMKWSISDYGATLLSEKFYEEYVKTKDPTEALRKARKSVGEATDWNDPAWAAPIIYVA